MTEGPFMASAIFGGISEPQLGGVPDPVAALLAPLDADMLDKMRRYAGQQFAKRTMVTETPLCEYSSESWTLPEFLVAIQGVMAQIPGDCCEKATVEFEGGGYDESRSFKITYQRWQTDAEVMAHVQRCIEYARDEQRKERAKYEKLKAKFG